jgi:zinc D-Ala-D-Ala dipeptidase
MDELKPLPELISNEGWRDVEIEPVDEPLLPIDQLHPRIIDRVEYARWEMPGALVRSWIREGVGERLVNVADALPAEMTLVVWDGYRPIELQAALFDGYVTELAMVHADWPADAIEEAAARFVTPPSRATLAPPPHLTGGAVDLTLGDANGDPLDLGTGFDVFTDEAGALAFEDIPGDVRDRRRLLFWAMHAQGFTSYNEEWWHFDYGNQFWGLVTNQPAIYSAAPHPESSRGA